jgi:hypothetical protein
MDERLAEAEQSESQAVMLERIRQFRESLHKDLPKELQPVKRYAARPRPSLEEGQQ